VNAMGRPQPERGSPSPLPTQAVRPDDQPPIVAQYYVRLDGVLHLLIIFFASCELVGSSPCRNPIAVTIL